MRISDWSSDVCSSDLVQVETAQAIGVETVLPGCIDARGLYLRLVERDGAVLVDLVIVDAVDAGTLDQAQEVLAAGRIDVDRAPVAGLPEAAVGFVEQQVAGCHVADRSEEVRGGKECCRTCRTCGWPRR